MHVIFSIEDMVTSEVFVGDIIGEIKTTYDFPKSSVSLPPSTFPARVDLISARINGYATTIAPYQAKNIKLPIGKYRTIIRIETPDIVREFSRNFLVSEGLESIRWEIIK